MLNNFSTMLQILIFLSFIGAIFLFIAFSEKKKKEPDYYILFIMGIVWLIVGIPLNNYILFTLGFIYSIVGLIHKDKWKKGVKTWEKLSKKEKRYRIVVILAIVIVIILGMIFYFFG